MPGAVRPVLDPGRIGSLSGEVSIGIVPPALRAFGKVPALDRLRSGDLLLFERLPVNFVGRWISDVQARAGFTTSHAAWTHAAIFLYDDIIVEALPFRGVVQSSLYERVLSHRILVRRDPVLESDAGYLIALRSLGMIRRRYSHFGALKLGWTLLMGLWTERRLVRDDPVVICSQVFSDAHIATTRRMLRDCAHSQPVTPAHLSATPDLVDVEIGWKRLT